MESLIIKNGRVIDPYNGIDEISDVVIRFGRISKIGKVSETDLAHQPSIDVSGCIVTPGLVDCHVHVYEYATPLGVNVDQRCLYKGVTAVVDAGSAGAATVPGLRKFIKDESYTRVYCFLHIAQHGLAAAGCVKDGVGGEIDSLNVVDVDDCVKTIKANRDMIVGIKLRLSADIADNGNNEQEAYRRALVAAKTAGVPLMVHHGLTTVTHTGTNGSLGCPGDLTSGDIYTHCFHGHVGSVIDPVTEKVSSAVWAAKKRGVLFDIGHGMGAFLWRVAEQCVSEEFWPDIISTDLHTDSVNGPCYDLACVMSKMMHLGMGVKDIIAAVTCTPAKAIGKLCEIGHLGVGMPADITVLRVDDIDKELEDVGGFTRTMKKTFTPVAVFKDGRQFDLVKGWPHV